VSPQRAVEAAAEAVAGLQAATVDKRDGGSCGYPPGAEFLLYDRMRTVVLGTSAGKPRLNPTFAAFAAHWGFTPRLCQPYRAHPVNDRGDFLYEIPPEDLPAKFAHKRDYPINPVTSSSRN
jgi:hypothetical protein